MNYFNRINRYKIDKEDIKEISDYINKKTKTKNILLNFNEKAWKYKNKKLFYDNKQVIPYDNIDKIIRKFYENIETTGGRDKLFGRLSQLYIGISRRDIAKFLKQQKTEQVKAPIQRPKKISNFVIAKYPFHQVEIDLLDMSRKNQKLNNGYRYVMNAIDRYSNYVVSIPMKKKDEKNAKKGLLEILKLFKKKPDVILTDKGSEFYGLFHSYLVKNKIKHLYNDKGFPLSKVERYNKTFRDKVRKNQNKYDSSTWVDLSDKIAKNYNTSINLITKITPSESIKLNDNDIKKYYNIMFRAGKKRLKNTKQYTILKKGDEVRLLLKNVVKDKPLEKEKSEDNYSEDIYIVDRIYSYKNGVYKYKLENSNKRYNRFQLLKVVDIDPKSEKQYKDRPIYNKKYTIERKLKLRANTRSKQKSDNDKNSIQLRNRKVIRK